MKNLSKYIHVVECDWFPQIIFLDKNLKPCDGLKTLVMQEMFKKKILFQGILIPSFYHNNSQIVYIIIFNCIINIYKRFKNGYKKYLHGKKLNQFLEDNLNYDYKSKITKSCNGGVRRM